MGTKYIHDPECGHCGERYSDHGDTEEPHDLPDCEDCGVIAGDEHSLKCKTVLEQIADERYHAARDQEVVEWLEKENR